MKNFTAGRAARSVSFLGNSSVSGPELASAEAQSSGSEGVSESSAVALLWEVSWFRADICSGAEWLWKLAVGCRFRVVRSRVDCGTATESDR